MTVRKIKSKIIYKAGDQTFEKRENAELCQSILDAYDLYAKAAKDLQDVLDKCTCDEKTYHHSVTGAAGKEWQDEYDQWHKELIQIDVHGCKCCGREWHYAAFGGGAHTWRKMSKRLVKVGIY
jgi:hypothetical protein